MPSMFPWSLKCLPSVVHSDITVFFTPFFSKSKLQNWNYAQWENTYIRYQRPWTPSSAPEETNTQAIKGSLLWMVYVPINESQRARESWAWPRCVCFKDQGNIEGLLVSLANEAIQIMKVPRSRNVSLQEIRRTHRLLPFGLGVSFLVHGKVPLKACA